MPTMTSREQLMNITHLKEVVVFRDDSGQVTAQKGTTCDLIEDGDQQWVEKQWVTGDWLFEADYEYQVEKHIYRQANALGLPVPTLLDADDATRMLRMTYLAGTRLATPCEEVGHLPAVLRFYDLFKGIAFPNTLPLSPMDGERLHQHRRDQFRYGFPREDVWRRVDALYQQCLCDIPHDTIPFDRILHNTLLCEDTTRPQNVVGSIDLKSPWELNRSGSTIFFYDFEWTIAGPHEFTLARIAVEFNRCDAPQILSRVKRLDLYHLCLLHFYIMSREPESIYRYLCQHPLDKPLQELFDCVTVEKYADQCWLLP